MEPEERITKLARAGVLSEAQAEMLRDSLGPRYDAGGPARQPRSRWAWWLAGALAATSLLALLIASVLGPDATEVQDVASALNEPGSTGEMNKTFSAVLGLATLFVVPLVAWVWMHNTLVGKEERTLEAWAQVESNFQRRADLIPALIDTVSRYLRHESETLRAVTETRASGEAGPPQAPPEAMDALIEAQREASELMQRHGKRIVEDDEALAALRQAQAAIGAKMASLLAVVESYPELRSSDQFLELQAQLEGTENRINVARMRFNEAVRSYNADIRRIPLNLVARAGDFNRKAYFRAEGEAEDAPTLDLR